MSERRNLIALSLSARRTVTFCLILNADLRVTENEMLRRKFGPKKEETDGENYVILGVSGKLLLAFASTVNLGSRPCGTHYNICQFYDSDL
jgi:hypothetical protein